MMNIQLRNLIFLSAGIVIIVGFAVFYHDVQHRSTVHGAVNEMQASAAAKVSSHLSNRVMTKESAKAAGPHAGASNAAAMERGPGSGPLTQQELRSYAALLQRTIGKYDKNAAKDLPAVMDVIYGNVDGLREKMDAGLSPNVKIPFDRFGNDATLLNIAIASGQRGIVRELVGSGANVNADSMNAPLVQAAGSGEDDVVKYLLDHGASIDQENGIGHTALDEALRGNHQSTVELLRAHGAVMPQGGG